MRRRLFPLLVLFALAVPALARVVSYAPYTNRIARTGYHLRTTRWFPLLEGDWMLDSRQKLVLYDSSGKEEPRILYPKSNEEIDLEYVAWKEGATRETSLALVGAGAPNGLTAPWLSRDGGETWTKVSGLDGKTVWDQQLDRGGPWVHGLRGEVRIGSAEWPFVLRLGGDVWAISATGQSKMLFQGAAAIVGQNRAGTAFLVETPVGILLLHVDGGFNFIRERRNLGGYWGWVAGDDSVYIMEGSRLYLHRGPQDVTEVYNYGSGPWGEGFIAVPTHDFNGAWIIDRGPGRPTALWHHTHTAGRSQMWSDVAAPEVEALIAGDSGQTVLIQVHRDRSVALQRPFIDPALAVWRVGQPAPRDYDELYLNEEQNKGFVHIDVDKVANGDPFVFDSGSFEDALEEGPISPPIGGGGDVIQEWGVVRGSLKQRLVLPGVARLKGAFNSNWLTDVTIYNPLDTPQQIEVQYVALGEAVLAESVRKITLTLKPFEIRFVPDALQALFLIENGGGALHFLPETAVNVVGRTYSSKDGGTFGFGMQAIDAMNAAGPNFPVTFAGAFPGDHFRTNMLLTDTSGRGTEVGVNAYGITGSLNSHEPTISAPANGIFQLNGLGSTLGLFGRDAGGLIVRPTRGTAIATVVAIDNRTNDATWFPPDLTATIPRAIPVIGHVDGAHGAHFRSDLYLFNPARQTRTVLLDAKQWDSSLIVRRQFTLLPNEARVIPDALVTLFGMSGLARLQYSTPDGSDGVRVTSRTYTQEPSGATYGSLIPPLNNFQIGTSGDALEILGAGGGAGFRTNLGLVELSPQAFGQPIRVRVRILGSERSTSDSFIVEVPRGGGMQIGDIFTARGIAAPTAALLVVEILDPGLIGAYATLTDNKTNDTTYLAAQLGGKEE